MIYVKGPIPVWEPIRNSRCTLNLMIIVFVAGNTLCQTVALTWSIKSATEPRKQIDHTTVRTVFWSLTNTWLKPCIVTPSAKSKILILAFHSKMVKLKVEKWFSHHHMWQLNSRISIFLLSPRQNQWFGSYKLIMNPSKFDFADFCFFFNFWLFSLV